MSKVKQLTLFDEYDRLVAERNALNTNKRGSQITSKGIEYRPWPDRSWSGNATKKQPDGLVFWK